MAQFNIHDAKTRFSQLVEMAERGEEVIVARHGKPVVRLVPLDPKKSILGIGVGDPNYIGAHLTDEEATAPLDPEELKLWYGEEE
jgi:prevent-host-death family protein